MGRLSRGGGLWRGLLLMVACVTSANCTSEPPAERLLRELANLRQFEGRRSEPVEYVPCDLGPPRDLRMRCRPADAEALPELGLVSDAAALAAERPEGEAGPPSDRNRALAVFDVLSSMGSPEATTRALTQLQLATSGAGPSADALNDLAWVLLARSDRGGEPFDLARALESTEQALRTDSAHEGARFNRALALERLGLYRQATQAWEWFSRGDDGWAREARARADRLREIVGRPSDDEADTDEILIGFLSAPDPEARASSVRQARASAARGDSVALGLITRFESAGGDGGLREALQAYGRAGALWEEGAFTDATDAFDAIARSLDDPRSGELGIVRWLAQIGLGRGRVYQGEYDTAQKLFQRVLEEADTPAYASIQGHAHWGMGVSLARQARWSEARYHYRRGRELFQSIDQNQSAAQLRYLTAETYSFSGDPATAFEEVSSALRSLASDDSNVKANLLSYTGRLVALDHPAAAIAYHREGLALSEGLRNPQYAVEARIRLAQAVGRAGDIAEADRLLSEADGRFEEIPDSAMRARIAVEMDELSAMLLPGLPPEERRGRLQRAIDYYGDRRLRAKLPALMERQAQVLLAEGDRPQAVQRFRDVLVEVESQLVATAEVTRRLSLIDAWSGAANALIDHYIQADSSIHALWTLERVRDLPSEEGPAGREAPPGDLQSIPEGVAVVAFAVTDERVHAWVVSDSGIEDVTLPRTPVELREDVDRLRGLLETEAPVGRVGPVIADLHAGLLDPLLPHLDGVTELILVPDGVLHRLPFAVLGRTPGEILDRYALRFAPSVRLALERGSARPVDRSAVVAVAGSDWDREAYPWLPPLPDAGLEVDSVLALHATALPAAPTWQSVSSALSEASVFHFAGHAILRDDRPGRSELVLQGDPASLGSADIASMELSGLSLVVLSACETQRLPPSRAGGFDGLSATFLRAGAGGVIGSLWPVRDDATRALMIDLHRGLADGEAAHRALVAAQRRDRDGGQGGWTWAAFRVEG